jgi:ABC-type Fe3+/spermidine/putrescine transport system ATPase subunit
VDLAIAAGEMVAITGPSGSGKSTIVNLIAGIDQPTAGTVNVNGSRLDQMSEEKLAVWRGRNIGIVFQFFQLLPTLTAAENAVLPLDLARVGSHGGTVYFPLGALQRLTGMGGGSNALWLTTASSSHAAIDRATTAVADRLAAAGYPVSTQETYVAEADNGATDDTILTVVEVLGLLVVVIALMGLVSALTMGVIERTREIGILRCLGARAGQVRRVFSAEGVLLATIGWAFGVPVGWLIYEGLLAFVKHDFGITAPAVYPAIALPVALVAVVAVTLLVIRPPLRRATRIQAGGALRYQ